VNTANSALDKKSYSYKIRATSSLSSGPDFVEFSFNVYFITDCWFEPLTAPNFFPPSSTTADAEEIMNVWDTSTLTFTPGVGAKTTCGEFTYKLFHDSTDVEVTQAEFKYSFDVSDKANPTLLASPDVIAMASDHLFYVAARYGIYDTIRSANNLRIVVYDPCWTSAFQSN